MAKAASLEDLRIKDAANGTNLADYVREDAPDIQEKIEVEKKRGLHALMPLGDKIKIRDEEIEIQEWVLGQAIDLAPELANFGAMFSGIRQDDIPMILALITSRLNVVTKIVSVTIGKDEEYCRNIPLNNFVDLAMLIYKKNERFFRPIARLLGEAMPNLRGTETAQGQQEEGQKSPIDNQSTGSSSPNISLVKDTTSQEEVKEISVLEDIH